MTHLKLLDDVSTSDGILREFLIRGLSSSYIIKACDSLILNLQAKIEAVEKIKSHYTNTQEENNEAHSKSK